MHRDLRVLQNFFQISGYVCVHGPQYDPFLLSDDGFIFPSMHVYTFTKMAGPLELRDQIIFHTGLQCRPDWHFRFMHGFDLSCCCVSYDGLKFQVAVDNMNPTTQPARIRRLNSTTVQRIDKYHGRGFAFVIPYAALLQTDPSVRDLISLCSLLLTWH